MSEPAILLMHHSLRSHPQITATLLDFLCRVLHLMCTICPIYQYSLSQSYTMCCYKYMHDKKYRHVATITSTHSLTSPSKLVPSYCPGEEQFIEVGVKAALKDILHKGVLLYVLHSLAVHDHMLQQWCHVCDLFLTCAHVTHIAPWSRCLRVRSWMMT